MLKVEQELASLQVTEDENWRGSLDAKDIQKRNKQTIEQGGGGGTWSWDNRTKI